MIPTKEKHFLLSVKIIMIQTKRSIVMIPLIYKVEELQTIGVSTAC